MAPGYIRPELVEFKGIPSAEGGVVYSASLGGYIQRARLVLKAGIAIPTTPSSCCCAASARFRT